MADRKRFNADRTGAIRGDFDAAPESLSFIPLARAYLDRGEAEKAEEVTRRALELRPNNALAWGLLGRALLGQGKLEDAETCLAQALAREKGDADLWRFMGELRLTQGRLGEGASYLEAAANLDPDDAELHAELQRVHAVLWRDGTGKRPAFSGGATELDARRVGPVDPSAADPGPGPPLFAAGKTKKG